MRSSLAIFSLIAILAFAGSCKKTTTGSKVPSIFLIKSGPDSVYSSISEQDSLLIIFNIKDADGDLGNEIKSGKGDIMIANIIDPNNIQFSKEYFPGLPYDYANPTHGIEAICTLRIPAAIILVPRPDPVHQLRDTAIYELYIVDKAGNASNHIITRPIYILP